MNEKQKQEYDEYLNAIDLFGQGEFSIDLMLKTVDPKNEIIKQRVQGILKEMKEQEIVITKDNFKKIIELLKVDSLIYKDE